MPGYRARYVRERYVKRDIRRDLYEAFVEWCGERSINICLEKALSVLRGSVPLSARTSTTSQSESRPPAQNTVQGKARPGGEEERASGGHEWCWSKAKVRSLQDFIEWVDSRFGLVDWWDEGDRYCFKTRRRPAKTE